MQNYEIKKKGLKIEKKKINPTEFPKHESIFQICKPSNQGRGKKLKNRLKLENWKKKNEP